METTLADLLRQQDAGINVAKSIAEVRASLQEHWEQQAQGDRIRTKEQWAEEGETSTKYFFRLAASRGMKRLFTGLRTAHGTIVHTLSGILYHWMLFYISLFAAIPLDRKEGDSFLDGLAFTLSSEDSLSCEGDVTLEECMKALNSFSSSKSPGVDGLTYEFYRYFWEILGPDLLSVLNSAMQKRSLTLTQRTGIITLLHKKNDRLDMKNWGPITLLCSDYKILSKVLTTHLSEVIASVISLCQSCGIPGRFSGESIHLLEDIVEHANTNSLGGALISLDKKKL